MQSSEYVGRVYSECLLILVAFFENLLRNKLAWRPGERVGYSDQAFMLLAMATQNMTGKSFADLLHESITKPLNMPITGLNPPERSHGAVPAGPGGIFWGYDIGNFN